MKMLKLKTLLVVGLLSVGLCVSCAKAQIKTVGLAEKQRKITTCSTEYIDCLDRTKIIKNDFDRFDAEVDKCVEAANRCPGQGES